MAHSEHYREMLKQISLLKKHLLPRKFDPTGSYAERYHLRALAYRVLVHSEVESFIEERVTSTALRAITQWKRSGVPSNVVTALVAFRETQPLVIPDALTPPQPNQKKSWQSRVDFSTKVQDALNEFIARTKRNNGIKEKHLLSLLLPIGLVPDDLDPLWLADMDSFGTLRGDAAHQSSVKRTVDPEEELTRVKNLCRGLAELDRAISRLR